MKRGSATLEAAAQRARDERLAQTNTARCLFCHWTSTGTVAETRAEHETHRRAHHPDATSTRRKQRPNAFPVSNKPVGQNIANAREQGAATWDGAAA